MKTEDIWKYNKGEWSEAYTLIKLLGDGKVYASDENLNKIEDEFYPILKILKIEHEKIFFVYDDQELIEVVDLEGRIQKTVKFLDFLEVSEKSFTEIKEGKGSSFTVPIIENFLRALGFLKFKAPNKNKSDLTMEIQDLKTFLSKEYTFSIKSEIGSKPSILNASNATNFIYKIDGIEEYEFDELMRINKKTDKKWLKLRILKILEKINVKNYSLSFHGIENEQFSKNLKLIDSSLPYILSQALLYYYSTEKVSDIKLLTEYLVDKNPLKLSDDEKLLFYKSNIIELIRSSTFGMIPTKRWNKEYDVNGGILTVKNDGMILCHHIFYNKKQLDKYLYQNTKFETGSTTRYKTGDLYKINNEDGYYFKLNLQIRMK
ncbi:MAG: HpaII family restriction endonuclease [Methanobrevibacter sp.]|jgi:hypothetical protein|nr:HpaII family restriction endonuclease [Candidatus Methanovirga basalitermitum]